MAISKPSHMKKYAHIKLRSSRPPNIVVEKKHIKIFEKPSTLVSYYLPRIEVLWVYAFICQKSRQHFTMADLSRPAPHPLSMVAKRSHKPLSDIFESAKCSKKDFIFWSELKRFNSCRAQFLYTMEVSK